MKKILFPKCIFLERTPVINTWFGWLVSNRDRRGEGELLWQLTSTDCMLPVSTLLPP